MLCRYQYCFLSKYFINNYWKKRLIYLTNQNVRTESLCQTTIAMACSQKLTVSCFLPTVYTFYLSNCRDTKAKILAKYTRSSFPMLDFSFSMNLCSSLYRVTSDIWEHDVSKKVNQTESHNQTSLLVCLKLDIWCSIVSKAIHCSK